jgi:hypothetical protein
MEMLCPECRGQLVTNDGIVAHCTLHPAVYQILFPPAVDQSAAGSVPPHLLTTGAALYGVKCSQHPNVSAVSLCNVCRMPVCATCDFVLPGGVHLCPQCASTPQTTMSYKRRARSVWSIALGGWSTIAFLAFFLGCLLSRSQEVLALLSLFFAVFCFIPVLVGLALGISAIERRQVNTWFVWVGIIWNAGVLGLIILLQLIGTLFS